jgi:hypothetical protein
MRQLRSILVCAGVFALAGSALAADVKEVRKTVDLAANGRLSIDTYKGWIEVSTWDRPQAEIYARVEPDDSDTDRHQADKVRETEISIEGSGSSVRVKTDYERVRSHHFHFFPFWGDSGTLPFVRYAIKMPRTARLQIHDYKSQTRIAGLASELDMTTYKGDVAIREMDGPVRLETYKGDVQAEYARFAASQFETTKGSIDVALPRQTAFSLDADMGRRGDLRNEFGSIERTMTGRRRHDYSVRDARINGGGPSLVLRTNKGELRIRAR